MSIATGGGTRLHFGCGRNLMEGWVNIDSGDWPGVMRFDLTQPLPWAAETIEFAYSEHYLEHLDLAEGLSFLREVVRILMPGGVFRLSTPDLSKLLEQYQERRIVEWLDVGWTPGTPCDMVNEGMRLWDHKYLYDREKLEVVLAAAGFDRICPVTWRASEIAPLVNLESRPFHGELIYEVHKAAG